MNHFCEYPGCNIPARQADQEYREWHPDDKRAIYCDPHCSYVDKHGVPKRKAVKICQYGDECTNSAQEVCFWCKKRVCRLHSFTPLRPNALNIACPGCNYKINNSWVNLPTKKSPFE